MPQAVISPTSISDLLRLLDRPSGREGGRRIWLLNRLYYRLLERDHDAPPHWIAYIHRIGLLDKTGRTKISCITVKKRPKI
jgi:hypothetical protein